MRSIALAALVLVVAVLSAPPTRAQAAVRVAVSDIQRAGIDPKVAKLFEDSLLAELRKLQRVSVIGMDEVRAMLDLEAQKQIVGCGEEQSCLAEIAGSLGADVLITGGIADVGDATSVTLKRIEQKSASVAQQFSQRLAKANGEELLAAVGPAVEQLFPETPLRAGAVRGVAPELALRLNPPPLPTWMFWTGAAVTGTVFGGTAVAAASWAFQQDATRELAASATVTPIRGSALKEQQATLLATETTAWVFVGASAACIAATFVMLPFVDWEGAGDVDDGA